MTMLVPLGILQLLCAPALMVPSVDYWDAWGPYGECSRSCGGGVTMRTRRCITHRTDGGHNCVGLERSYSSCNIQDCPEGSRDFREEQCSQFDGSDFQGKRYKWIPYYGAENPCELNCMPVGENFFYRHRIAVVDGTPCHPGRRDVCVAGICKRLGCDNTLKSLQQEDPCLQCGGNGPSCQRVKSSFSVHNLPTGYNQMFVIPVGATTISIRETVATRNYLAIRNLRGDYYLNGHWVIQFSKALPIAGTMLYYQRGSEGNDVPETITGRGPTTEPLVVELISQEPNQGVEYEYYLLNERSREGYYWSFGSWSTCSRECGSGYQSRVVFCTIGNDAYPDHLCASLLRPQSNRTCNPHPCPQTHSWRTGEWSSCSVTCGGGSQQRSVQCISHGASGPRLMEDAVCTHLGVSAEAPPSVQNCNMQKCPEYRVSRWSACSVTCGPGEQTREVTCIGSGGVRLEETSCSSVLRPHSVQPCETAACLVPSIQDPEHETVHRLETDLTQTNTVHNPHSSAPTLHCSQSYYGCCSDGQTSARGPEGLGCPQAACIQTSYGCCQDGVTGAQGPNKEGCAEYVAPAPTVAVSLPTENAAQCRTTTYGCCYDRTTPARGPNGEDCPSPPDSVEHSLCSLPRAAGSCSSWVSRYHYDVITSKCLHFWYGGCHGNANNFLNQGECQRACQQAPRSVAPAGESRNMGRVFTVHGGGRQASSAAYRARLYRRVRRPSAATVAGHSGPAASLTLEGVKIDKTDPPTVEALVGQTVLLPCTVNPPPSSTVAVEWRRDGVPLSTHRHHQQPSGSLLIGPVTKLDSGWFLCVATRERERDHRYIYLSVSEASSQLIPTPLPRDGPFPRFSIDRSSSSQLEMRTGQTAKLPCTIVPPSARQSVNIHWTKDGQSLSNSRFSKSPDGILIISPLKLEDAGLYRCTVSNQHQLEQRQLKLKVKADLRITTAPNNIQVSEGSQALLPCVVSGDNVNIGWSRNGVPIRPDGRNILLSSDGSLILNNVKPSEEGTYTCNAYTGIYSVSATAEVKVIKDTQRGFDVPPECVDQPELANCELIVYARLCSNLYYSSFCCASCTRHSQRKQQVWSAGLQSQRDRN
ncbi:papilin isoform X1 [Channa argus]|uniref:papilin isoform X1 n=1 Tax=Channa argus TaxID=215402 RepID=UPI003522E4A7